MTILSSYITQTRRLLQNPSPSSNSLYSDALLTAAINTARGQLAGDGECMRSLGTVTTSVAVRSYTFDSVSFAVSSAVSGVAGVLNIHAMLYGVGGGSKWVTPRPWEWFLQYSGLNNPVPTFGAPTIWAQFGQGVGASASFYVDPLPNANFTLTLDVGCYPIDLVDDTTVDAIPFPWTDAVPYFAAYQVLLSAQSPARDADAERMMKMYENFRDRARRYTTPPVTPGQFPQSGDPTRPNQLSLVPQRGQ